VKNFLEVFENTKIVSVKYNRIEFHSTFYIHIRKAKLESTKSVEKYIQLTLNALIVIDFTLNEIKTFFFKSYNLIIYFQIRNCTNWSFHLADDLQSSNSCLSPRSRRATPTNPQGNVGTKNFNNNSGTKIETETEIEIKADLEIRIRVRDSKRA
jgi:hypothetical protein